MEMTTELADALARVEGEPMAALYREAAERLTVEHDSEGPYWETPDQSVCALTADTPTLLHDDGTDEAAEAARRRGWELIVLADLAEIAARGQEEQG